nr:leucine-rich repeat receptor-like serine/threonine-protein kinase BAM3 [Ipomoea batatas]
MGLCNWTGVTCDSYNKSVVSLDVSNLNLSGPLSPAISELQSLVNLSVAGNSLFGDLHNISGLRFLNISNNLFSGCLDWDFSGLVELEVLDVYDNNFSCPLPVGVTKLTKLRHLDFGGNYFSGRIPPGYGGLNQLRFLSLAGNDLIGLIPRELGNLSSLKWLQLGYYNRYDGGIPGELGRLTNLVHLDLSSCGLEELPKLQALQLWRNNFTGFIPQKLGQNGQLILLDLSTNKLTGQIPKSLCYGNKLKILILLDNFLFGPLPDDLGQCQTLSRVRIGQNYLSGPIPDRFLYLPKLTLVELQDNHFTGRIAFEKTTASSKLEGLNLSNNHLSGYLPTSIGNFSGLKNLMLSGNRFSGQIPSEIGWLKGILKLDMSRNNFSGNIPSEISNCPSLTYLDLSQNQLSGPIPIQIARIRILNYFNVSWNHLNQSLPEEIGSMKSLTSADFSHNNFTGSVPETGQYLFFNSTSFTGNPYLCASYLIPCNSSSNLQSQLKTQSGKSNVPARYKLIFAMGLLLCSLVFVVFAVIKTREVRKNSRSWKLTAFQKLDFGSEDVLGCLKDSNIIGRGGAGVVYKGTMPNGHNVAVKNLGICKGSHDNGLSAEVQTLGKIRHRYIVRLLAFCSNKETNLLVYEYMPNGSLGEVLHGKSGGYLNWETRLKIAIEAAKGLSYLHHDCSPLIIHRDVKSNNILLDSDYEAHVADFGLAKFFQNNGTSECIICVHVESGREERRVQLRGGAAGVDNGAKTGGEFRGGRNGHCAVGESADKTQQRRGCEDDR